MEGLRFKNRKLSSDKYVTPSICLAAFTGTFP